MLKRYSLVTPADWISGVQQGQWTYKDYAAVPEDGQRYDVVDGILYVLPANRVIHQQAIGEVMIYLHDFLRATDIGEVFLSPLDVELGPKDIVQPDVTVVMDEHSDRVKESHIIGTPDLVVEVISANTMRHDVREKSDAYARAKVPECWLVNPDEQTVEVLVLVDGVYRSEGLFQGGVKLPSQVLQGFSVLVEQFFDY